MMRLLCVLLTLLISLSGPAMGGYSDFGRWSNAAKTGAGVVDDAFSHGLKYHPRIRTRGVEDGVGHNFPYSFDDAILKTKPITQADGSLLYRMPGNINKTDGVFEMAVNPQTQTIFHRQFRGN